MLAVPIDMTAAEVRRGSKIDLKGAIGAADRCCCGDRTRWRGSSIPALGQQQRAVLCKGQSLGVETAKVLSSPDTSGIQMFDKVPCTTCCYAVHHHQHNNPHLPQQVRFLADLLLGRLGFSALVVHLEPIAASFGNGTTSACVVNVGSSSCSVCCIDDAVVLPPAASRYSLPVGLVDIAGALTGWMSCYSHWPLQLQQHGLGGGLSSSGDDVAAEAGVAKDAAADASARGSNSSSSSKPAAAGGGGGLSPADVYNMLLLEDLVLQQCYYPKVRSFRGACWV